VLAISPPGIATTTMPLLAFTHWEVDWFAPEPRSGENMKFREMAH
jgi:hypothetical protein